jgi:hypothetical protein
MEYIIAIRYYNLNSDLILFCFECVADVLFFGQRLAISRSIGFTADEMIEVVLNLTNHRFKVDNHSQLEYVTTFIYIDTRAQPIDRYEP